MRNVRMPRACKRTRQSQTEIKATRTSGQSQEIIQEQDNRRYAEPVPDVTIHYTLSGSIPSPIQNPPVTYGRPPKRQRMEGAELSNNMLQNHPGARYPIGVPSPQELSPSYARPTRNFGHRNPNISQVLYPNMMQAPRSTAPYSVPDQYSVPKQIPQAATAPEQQATGYRYNTRRSVHNLNLPMSTAPNMTNYWNSTNNSNIGATSIPPTTQNIPSTIQTRQSTQKQKVSPEFKNIETQTELTLTDDEVALIKTLRAKSMDPKKLNFITENNQFVVTYNDDSRIETVNTLMKASQDFKISLLTKFYSMSCEAKMAGLLSTMNPAITYPGSDNGNTSNNDEGASSSGQQCSQAQLPSTVQAATQPANAVNNDSTPEFDEGTPPPQPQVPQQRASRQENQSLPIPSILDQWNNFRRFHQCRYPERSQMRPNFNTPYHLLQNFQNNPRMGMDANFFPHMHAQEQYRMPNWF